MAIYDFLTEDCRAVDPDDGDGLDCPDDAAALREAALTAAAMAKDELAGDGPARSFVLQVREGGRPVGTVRVDVTIETAAI